MEPHFRQKTEQYVPIMSWLTSQLVIWPSDWQSDCLLYVCSLEIEHEHNERLKQFLSHK